MAALGCIVINASLSFISFLGKDNVCCYSNSGSLLDSRVEEGGTLQRYHYLGSDGVIPYITNFYYDVLPFLHCCRYFGHVTDLGHRGVTLFSECQTYTKFRNISSCYNYVPPRPGIIISCTICEVLIKC